MLKACSDEEFRRLFESSGPTETAKVLGVDVRNVFHRRRTLENNTGETIRSPFKAGGHPARHEKYPYRIPTTIDTGIVIVGSDAHVWPGPLTTCQRAIGHFVRELKPELKLLNMNGDIKDGAKISRHPPLGWARLPSIVEELRAVEEFMTGLEDAAGSDIPLVWDIGNHDARFEARLAAQAPDFQGVQGFRLQDHFARWTMAWSNWINEEVVIKHRFKGGVHATHNNTLNAGKTMVTGHLHSLKVTPFDDYNGTRFGVDTGTLNDPHGEHTEYVEDNPLNHRSGFAILTFHKGKLLWPELVAKFDEEHVQFRGKLIKV